MHIPVLLSAAVVEVLELMSVLWVACDLFCFHVVADVSMESMAN